MGHEEVDARAQAMLALQDEFSALFFRVRYVFAEMAQRVHPGMLPGTYKVLSTVARLEQVTLSHLAESLLADKGQVSRSVSELEELGFVARTPDPADRRSSLIHLTPHGTRRLDEARHPMYNPLTQSLERWDVPEIERLTELLHALTNATEPSRLSSDH